MLILAQVAALVLTAAPASVLDGCAAQASERGWTYTCEALVVSIDDSEVEPARRLRAFDEAVRGIAGTGKVTRTAERRALGKVTADVVRIDVPETGARLVAAVVSMPRGARMIACRPSKPGRDRCDEVLGLLAAVPWRSGPVPGTRVEREAGALLLAGHEVQVPPGCQGQPKTLAGTGVVCSDNWVKWQSTSQAVAGPLMEKWERMNEEEARRQQLSLSKETIPCRIGGVATHCRRLRVAAETDYSITSLIGAAQVNGEYLLVMCYSRDGAKPAVPCSLVVDVR